MGEYPLSPYLKTIAVGFFKSRDIEHHKCVCFLNYETYNNEQKETSFCKFQIENIRKQEVTYIVSNREQVNESKWQIASDR